MTSGKGKDFTLKHASEIKPDSAIADEITKRTKNGELPCAVAFEIAEKLHVSPAKVGLSADLLQIKLVKCQLGLFGFKPQEKPVKSQIEISKNLRSAIENVQANGNLSCKTAWEIASRLEVQRLAVSRAGEAMNIKIKSCQLGAF